MTASGKYDRAMALARELDERRPPGPVKARRILPVRATDGILGEQRARWRWMDSAGMRARVARARRGGA